MEYLEHFRSRQCAQQIEDLLKHDMEPGTKGKLKEIQEQLKVYEDDAAELLLRRLLQQLNKEG